MVVLCVLYLIQPECFQYLRRKYRGKPVSLHRHRLHIVGPRYRAGYRHPRKPDRAVEDRLCR